MKDWVTIGKNSGRIHLPRASITVVSIDDTSCVIISGEMGISLKVIK